LFGEIGVGPHRGELLFLSAAQIVPLLTIMPIAPVRTEAELAGE
jgi:hypothetical protein